MGMSLKDYAQAVRNIDGKKNVPIEKKIKSTKGKFCFECGFEIKSAIMRTLMFEGDYCVDCIGKVGKNG